MNEQAKRAPIQTLRDGAVVVKIWEQNGQNGPYVTATLGRTYKNEQTGEFGESRSFSGADVLKAQALLGEANKEMIRWRENHKEMARQQSPDQAPADQAMAQPNQGLATQRDKVLSNAKQPTSNAQPTQDHGPDL